MIVANPSILAMAQNASIDYSKFQKRPLADLFKNSLDDETYRRCFHRLGRFYQRSESSLYELEELKNGTPRAGLIQALTNIFGRKVDSIHVLFATNPLIRPGWMVSDHQYRHVVKEVLGSCFTSTFDELLIKRFPIDKFERLFLDRMDKMLGMVRGRVIDYHASAQDPVVLNLARLLHKNFEAQLQCGDIKNSIWEKIVFGYARLLYLYFSAVLAPYHQDEADLLEGLVDLCLNFIPVGHYKEDWTMVVKSKQKS